MLKELCLLDIQARYRLIVPRIPPIRDLALTWVTIFNYRQKQQYKIIQIYVFIITRKNMTRHTCGCDSFKKNLLN